MKPTTLGAYNLGGTNATGQVPDITGNFALIDKDTPDSALTRTSLEDGSEWDLVFSDEFNVDGRTFYAGDDPFWEAVDLHVSPSISYSHLLYVQAQTNHHI